MGGEVMVVVVGVVPLGPLDEIKDYMRTALDDGSYLETLCA